MKQYPEWIQEVNGELWLTENDRGNMQVSYRLKKIIFSKESSIQHIMIVDSYDFGRMLVLDGVVQSTDREGHIYNEMITHVPLSLHQHAKKVLIIGGGDCGAAREAVKYKHVTAVDMVEIDEMVVKACKEHLPLVSGNLADERVQFHYRDGVQFIAEKKNEYDVIIIDSSDPVGPAIQLFEYRFYEQIKHALKDDGIMVCQSQSPLFQQELVKGIYEKIKDLFTHVAVYQATVPTYPGGFWSFTIGTKATPITTEDIEIPGDLQTNYFNQNILRSCFMLPEAMKL